MRSFFVDEHDSTVNFEHVLKLFLLIRITGSSYRCREELGFAVNSL